MVKGQKCTETCKHTHGNLRQKYIWWDQPELSKVRFSKNFLAWIKISPKVFFVPFVPFSREQREQREESWWFQFQHLWGPNPEWVILRLTMFHCFSIQVFAALPVCLTSLLQNKAVRCFPAGTEWWRKISVCSAFRITSVLRRSWAGWHAVSVLKTRPLLHLSPVHLQSEAKISHLDASLYKTGCHQFLV